MTCKVRCFFVALFALLAVLAVIYQNEGLLRVSVRGLAAVCGVTLEPASRSTPGWQPSPTQGSSQGTGGPASAISIASSSEPFGTSTLTGIGLPNPDLYSGLSNSKSAAHLTFTCSSISPYRARLWLNGGLRSSEVEISDICLQELVSKLCTAVATGPSATLQSTPQS